MKKYGTAIAFCVAGLLAGLLGVYAIVGVAAGEALGPASKYSILVYIPALISTAASILVGRGLWLAKEFPWDIRYALFFLTAVPVGIGTLLTSWIAVMSFLMRFGFLRSSPVYL